jgi:hypothetical protein
VVVMRVAVAVVGQGLVGVVAVDRGGTGVDDGVVETRNCMEQGVLDFVGDLVGVVDTKAGGDGDLGFAVHAVPDPTDPKLIHGLHAGNATGGVAGLAHELGIDGIHESHVDAPGGVLDDQGDGDGDHQADDGVGGGIAQCYPGRTQQHGE